MKWNLSYSGFAKELNDIKSVMLECPTLWKYFNKDEWTVGQHAKYTAMLQPLLK